jgi:hypothetical protein
VCCSMYESSNLKPPWIAFHAKLRGTYCRNWTFRAEKIHAPGCSEGDSPSLLRTLWKESMMCDAKKGSTGSTMESILVRCNWLKNLKMPLSEGAANQAVEQLVAEGNQDRLPNGSLSKGQVIWCNEKCQFVSLGEWAKKNPAKSVVSLGVIALGVKKILEVFFR